MVHTAARTVTAAAHNVADTATQMVTYASANASTITHLALGAATFIPVVGAAAAVADAGLYTYEGDYLSASLSMLAVVPGGELLGDAAKLARGGEKAVNVVNDVEKIEKVATDLEKVENAASKGERAASGAEKAASGADEAAKEGEDLFRRAIDRAIEPLVLAGILAITTVNVRDTRVSLTERSPFADWLGHCPPIPDSVSRFDVILRVLALADALRGAPPVVVAVESRMAFQDMRAVIVRAGLRPPPDATAEAFAESLDEWLARLPVAFLL